MELRALRYFLEVARTGTLTAAAAKLNVTQPALSRQIKVLETELDVTLINRDHKPISLTSEGIYLAKQAETMLAIADKTVLNLHTNETLSGEITIGAAETKMFSHIINVIAEMQHLYPNVVFTIVSGATTDLLEKLDQGMLDFLFALDFNQKASYDYIDFPEGDVRGAYLNPKHPLANEQSITVEQLQQYPILISRQSSFKDSLIDELGISTSDLNVKLNYNLLGNASLYPKIDTEVMLVSIIWKHTPFLSVLHETFISLLDDELHPH